MWPLDVCIAALAGLVLYLIVSQLSFHDPRWQHNALTYVIAIPVIATVLAFLARGIASNYLRQSIQLGFLFSVFVHLLLLALAVNVIIFSRYFPDAFTGVKPERSPVSRTVPEYLFKTPEERTTQPDWSRPADAQTSTPVIPEEQRQLPPVEHTAPRLEIPKPRDPIERPMQKHLIQRDKLAESLPQPSDSPAKLARRTSESAEMTAPSNDSPTAPSVPVQADAEAKVADRQSDLASRSSATNVRRELPTPSEPSMKPTRQPSLAGARQRTESLPMIGDAGVQRERRERAKATRPEPSGAAPLPPTVAVARELASADRMLSPIQTPLTRQGQTTGAQLTLGESPAAGLSRSTSKSSADAQRSRSELAAAAGVPNVAAGSAMRAPGRSQRGISGAGFAPVGEPDPSGSVAAAVTPNTDVGTSLDVNDRAMPTEPTRRSPSSSATTAMQSRSMAGPSLELDAEEGPLGLADLPNRATGVVPSQSKPTIAAIDLTSGTRRKREVGGPVTPFGTKIAAVESFSRRVMRTEGGTTPTPAGLVGPATEEAIEKGLAYLSSTQNRDGSWSLQGHGSDVSLRSDSAATGLALLAFQGAGYTHREHQYADTVSRGLKFLIENQRTNGDLYRLENAISNQNVAFYSHGIASLALCEAFGMTQDADLKQPAQRCLDFIAATQNRTYGGWRYSAQNSSDTSVSGWMMMALKSGQLSGLEVSKRTYDGIDDWLDDAQSPDRDDRYRYDPYAPDTPTQRHGRLVTPSMTAVGILMRMYSGWRRDTPAMRSAADYLLEFPPQMGTSKSPQRDAYYWYYATQVMFHMGGDHWKLWNQSLNPVLLESQIDDGEYAGSWDPIDPVPDKWSVHAGRIYVTTMNLLNLEVYYRHLPIYEDAAE